MPRTLFVCVSLAGAIVDAKELRLDSVAAVTVAAKSAVPVDFLALDLLWSCVFLPNLTSHKMRFIWLSELIFAVYFQIYYKFLPFLYFPALAKPTTSFRTFVVVLRVRGAGGSWSFAVPARKTVDQLIKLLKAKIFTIVIFSRFTFYFAQKY